jgi:hypothetical protein
MHASPGSLLMQLQSLIAYSVEMTSRPEEQPFLPAYHVDQEERSAETNETEDPVESQQDAYHCCIGEEELA